MEEKKLGTSVQGHKTLVFCLVLILIGVIVFAVCYSTLDSFDRRDGIIGRNMALLFIGPMVVIAFVIYLSRANCELTITDKRVYGKAKFSKGVDLPLDSITAVGTGAFNGLSVSTASGIIKFADISNRDELYHLLSALLVERQRKEEKPTTMVNQEIVKSDADELKKFKKLLDEGIITQEEFNAKKKQLLGL